MTWLLLLVLLQAIMSQVADACLDIAVKDSCGDLFSMEVIEDACVRYNGGYLGSCTLEFTNSDTRQQQICIKPETLQLSCSTERKFTCGQISYDEWCDDSSSVFIKLRSSGGSDKVTLKVYLETGSISVAILVAICVSSAVVLCFVISCVTMVCCKRHNRNVRVSAGPRNVTMHTSAGYYRTGLSGNQQAVVGGYQSYPTGIHAPPETRLRQTPRGHESIPLQPVSHINTSPRQFDNQKQSPVTFHTASGQSGNQSNVLVARTSTRHQSNTKTPMFINPRQFGNQSSHQAGSQLHPMQATSQVHTSPRQLGNQFIQQAKSQLHPMQATGQVHTSPRQLGSQSSHQVGNQIHSRQAASQARTSTRHSQAPSPVPGARMNSQTMGYQSLTPGTSDYQPQMSPSGAPPSYEAAMSSTYDERMKEYKLEWDSKR
ncbi:uncharacterized protein LOC123564852 isoform X2 [Mercenaria mercenaria]|uniref:uncharacterized protein LOC123564852 isoform X2 n=1 Tax=Mercenaria mercenaria TaxID=6596 RepID=UPI00234E3C31|nr:uncharacterized protein LOC123564852 isoform X2 [Mercenaria mercenaria]